MRSLAHISSCFCQISSYKTFLLFILIRFPWMLWIFRCIYFLNVCFCDKSSCCIIMVIVHVKQLGHSPDILPAAHAVARTVWDDVKHSTRQNLVFYNFQLSWENKTWHINFTNYICTSPLPSAAPHGMVRFPGYGWLKSISSYIYVLANVPV